MDKLCWLTWLSLPHLLHNEFFIVICHSIASYHADLKYYSQFSFFVISITENLESLDYF
jgi:hypothetical protein